MTLIYFLTPSSISNFGRVVIIPNIAIIIAILVKIPKQIVGKKLDNKSIEKPKAIVIEVVKIALPTDK